MQVDPQEERIVRLCKKNSREGYGMLYDRYHRLVYAMCYRSTYNKDDAMDLVQEVFVRIFKGMEGFDPSKPLLPWIRRITVNTLINHTGRKPRNELIMDFSEDSPLGAMESENPEERPEESVAGKETKSVIEECISKLPGNERTVIMLRHIEGKSYDEIARIMNCPMGTIKTYIYRGRRMLRDSLVESGVWEV